MFAKLQYYVIILTAMLLVGCNVDRAYDLSALDADSIGIGTDQTYFDLPLATIRLTLSSATTDDGSRSGTAIESAVDYLTMISNITKFLPTDLSGDYSDGIDITLLSDESYTSGLVDCLIEELAADEQKRLEFCEYILTDGDEYPSLVATIDDITSVDVYSDQLDAQTLSDELCDTLTSSEELNMEITKIIVESSEDVTNQFTISEILSESITIDQGTIDLITKNLDGQNNRLDILSSVETNLPMSVSLTPLLLIRNSDGTLDREISICDLSDSFEGAGGITEDEFITILERMELSIDVVFGDDYIPTDEDIDVDSKYMLLTLIARKSGSLRF